MCSLFILLLLDFNILAIDFAKTGFFIAIITLFDWRCSTAAVAYAPWVLIRLHRKQSLPQYLLLVLLISVILAERGGSLAIPRKAMGILLACHTVNIEPQ